MFEKFALVSACFFTISFFFCSDVHAWSRASYNASLVSVSSASAISPEGTQEVSLTLKNTGSAPWEKKGANFVSLYHWDPIKKVETPSSFAAASWINSKQAMLLPLDRIRTGEEVTFVFTIRAPSAIGTYKEEFILAAENVAWIKGSRFALSMDVKQATLISKGKENKILSEQELGTQPWAAKLVEKPGNEWQLDVEEKVSVILGFQNIGTRTWKRDDVSYVSLYATQAKKERKSSFSDDRWISLSHVVRLKESEVKPGGIGHFVVPLRAPRAPGFYEEEFTLAAENSAWIDGGSVTLPIHVPLTSEFIATAPPGNEITQTISAEQAERAKSGLNAILLLRSATQLLLLGNGNQELTFGFKNTGTSVWNSRGVRVTEVIPSLTSSSVRDDSWIDETRAARVHGETKPGEIGFISFRIKAPSKRGAYTVRFVFEADDQFVNGGEVEIPITVTADGATNSTNAGNQLSPSLYPALTNLVPLNGDLSSLPSEPIIRVGLFKTTDDRMIVRAKYVPLSVVQQDGSVVCRIQVGESATITFDRTYLVYKALGPNCAAQTTTVMRVRADDGVSPMEIADFSRPVSWLPGANDNTFRAQLELRYTPSTNNVWIINELSIEYYLKGIAETSNSSPQEYQRALLTAARTYAMYHVQRGTKHANENYTVDATYDQVYRGYGAEARGSNIVAAVEATRGQIVSYDGKLAITPYYSRSDGRTRAWTEVWGGGPYPWLVSVPVPWDAGRTLWGHGVGMSASGALGMSNDGKRYDEILKYFYQQTDIRLIYR